MPLGGGGGLWRVSAFRRLELGEGSRQPLTREEQEMAEAAERMLQTPIDTSTPEGQRLEVARLTNLAERQRLLNYRIPWSIKLEKWLASSKVEPVGNCGEVVREGPSEL